MTEVMADTAFPATDLPTPRVQNHASFLHELPDGTILCAWFGGTIEGKSDISILMSRFDGRNWSNPVQLSDDPARSEQNPVLFTAPDGRLWLIYTAQPGGRQNEAEVRFRISDDGGQSWTEPCALWSQKGIFVRQPVIVADDGAWLLPGFRCRVEEGVAWTGENDDSVVMVSHDEGVSWKVYEVPGSLGCVHMNIVPLADGGMAAFYRSRWADHIWRSHSADGVRWSAPEPAGLPNNNSSIQAVRLDDGRIAMVYNHSSREDAEGRRVSLYDEIEEDGAAPAARPGRAFWGAPRAPLSLALSADGGQSWPDRIDLAFSDGYCLSNNSADQVNRELSYPSILQDRNGRVHVTWTHFRQSIRHMIVPLDEQHG
ncbi:exo-alpha-sialidase [Rhodovulum sp. MB263]|uniref:sialidase family protein n=1 Tax=Rhodovulum sp. (strain MB263) TaxID=308754 RepID=UPI0009B7D666|nr:exo-alpha-sialidase [Rhodovulum sp. MB263]ARC89782.1 glycosyl hydrolase [Rhodovulum sp. MB263]